MAYKSAVMGGKQSASGLASLASHKPDFRRDISAWGALKWAYADQSVRAATHCGSEPAFYCSNGLALMRVGETGIGGGAINGLLEAHPDAWAIDNLVANWFDEWPEWRNGVAVYAESRRLPPSVEQLPRFKVDGPKLNAKNNPVVLYSARGGRSAYLCPLEVSEGATQADIDRHAAFLAMFNAMLDIMPGLKLEKWKIVSSSA